MARNKTKGDRYACGKLRPDRSPSAIRQMVSLAEKKLLDPLFGTQIGILHLQGHITAPMVSAARHYAELMGAYDALVCNPSRTARSPDYEMGRLGQGASMGADDRPGLVERVKKLRDKIATALNGPSGEEWRAVYDTVLLDQHCGVMQRGALASGLQSLSYLFGFEVRPQHLDAPRTAA